MSDEFADRVAFVTGAGSGIAPQLHSDSPPKARELQWLTLMTSVPTVRSA